MLNENLQEIWVFCLVCSHWHTKAVSNVTFHSTHPWSGCCRLCPRCYGGWKSGCQLALYWSEGKCSRSFPAEHRSDLQSVVNHHCCTHPEQRTEEHRETNSMWDRERNGKKTYLSLFILSHWISPTNNIDFNVTGKYQSFKPKAQICRNHLKNS